MKTKLTVLLLAVMLISAVLASCQSDSTSKPEQTTADTAETTSAETVSDVPVFPNITFDGEAVHFLTVKSTNDSYTSFEIFAEGMDGSLINDTVYERNMIIEDKFDTEITEYKAQNAHTVASDSILAGDDEYDIVAPYLNNSISNALLGQYYNLNSVNNIDITNSWWDQPARESLEVAGKLYFATGDISILDNECTMVIFFNKQMVKEFDIESPYDMVNNGTWTLDKMFDISASIGGDVNGDGVIKNEDDRFGFNCAFNSPHSLYFAAGERIVSTDENGRLQLVMNNSRVADVVGKILERCYGEGVMRKAASVTAVADALMNGRVMFTGWALTDISYIRDSEQDFGLIPYPKYDESQSDYYSLISTALVPGFSIPITNPEPDKAGLILEAMAYYSVDTLTEAYYYTALNDRYIRDTESGEMLDIIFNSRVYDFGFINNIGGLGNLIANVYSSESNTFASQYASLEPAALTTLEELNDSFFNE